jgi:hypothetical protein
MINGINEVKKLNYGSEIDVTVEIDEDEYREACWFLVLSKMEVNLFRMWMVVPDCQLSTKILPICQSTKKSSKNILQKYF